VLLGKVIQILVGGAVWLSSWSKRSLRREGSGRAVRSVASFATQYRTPGSLPCQTTPIPRFCMLCNLSVLCTSTGKSG